MGYYVYLLASQVANRTYVGYTVNLSRRLRQHNGEIVGGAKYTRAFRPWKMVCYVEGLPSDKVARQLEWRLHHPPPHLQRKRKKYKTSLEWRLSCLEGVLKMPYFTKTCPPTNKLDLRIVYR
jgi:predicted GIY-YIG superfamily endonuclease